MSYGGITAGKAFVVIEALDKTQQGLINIEKRLQQWGSNVQNIGVDMASKGAAMLLPIGLSLKEFISFDDAMKKVEARAEGTASEMVTLIELAKRLGMETAFTSEDMGRLMAALAQKGFNRADIANMTEPIMLLARAAGEGKDLMLDSAQAASLVSGTLRAYKLEASDAARVSDLMAATVNSSNYSLEELIVSLQYAAPAAAEFGQSMETTLASLAAMRDLNIDSSIAGTAFRNMFTYMSQSKERDKFNETLKRLTGNTIEFIDAFDNLNSVPDILMSMERAMSGLGTAQRSDMLSEMFGTRAAVPALALGKAAETFQKTMNTLGASSNYALEASKKMESGLGGAWREFQSAVESVRLAVGEALNQALIPLVDLLNAGIRVVSRFVERHKFLVGVVTTAATIFFLFGASLILTGMLVKTLAFSISGLAIVFGLAKWAVVGFALAFGVLKGMILGFVLAFATVEGVVALILGSLVIAILYVTGALDWMLKKGLEVFTVWKLLFTEWYGLISSILGAIADGIMNGNYQKAWEVSWLGMRYVFEKFKDFVLTGWAGMMISIVKLLSQAVGEVGVLFDNLINKNRKTWFVYLDTVIKGAKAIGLPDASIGGLKALRDTLKNPITLGTGIRDSVKGATDRMTRDYVEESRQRKRSLGALKYNLDIAMKEAKKRKGPGDKQPAPDSKWKAKDLIREGGLAGPLVAPEAIVGADKFSIEAGQRAQENRFNLAETIREKMLAELEKAGGHLERIDRALADGIKVGAA